MGNLADISELQFCQMSKNI